MFLLISLDMELTFKWKVSAKFIKSVFKSDLLVCSLFMKLADFTKNLTQICSYLIKGVSFVNGVISSYM